MAKGAEKPKSDSRSRADDDAPTKKVHVAGMWRRLMATLVDGICLAPILLLTAWLALRVIGTPLPDPAKVRVEMVLETMLDGGGMLYSLVALTLAILLLYGILFMTISGATPGLRMLRLRVINVYGDPPEWWRMILRSIGFLTSCLFLGLGFLWIGFDREKRGLPDWLAGTYVIRQKQT